MSELYEGDDPYIFASYAHEDDAAVKPIVDHLIAAGYRVWYDRGIGAGQDWLERMADRVDRCACMVAFVSRNSVDSKYCVREIHMADKRDKVIIPVYLDDVRLSPRMEMLLDLSQALFRKKYGSDRELAERLVRESSLEPCLHEAARARRSAIEDARNALSSQGKSEHDLQDALSALRSLEDQDDVTGHYAGAIEDRLRMLESERGLRDALAALLTLRDVGEGGELGMRVGQVGGCLDWLEAERGRLAREERDRREAERAQRAEEARRDAVARDDAERELRAREAETKTPVDTTLADRLGQESSRTHPRAFISYSWTSDAYQDQVVALADRLYQDGVDVVIDVYDLEAGDDKYAFMERCVTDPSIDKVLILCDRAYVEKADGRRGGVGDETAVISSKVYGKVKQNKYIPVLMERGEHGEALLPAYLGSRMYIDLSDDAHEGHYAELLRSVFGKPMRRRPRRDGEADAGEVQATQGAAVRGAGGKGAGRRAGQGIVVSKAFAEYSWAELKAIADEIAAAGEGEWLEIAKRYGLVDAGGKLGNVRKPVEIAGDIHYVRIAGFRHDDLAGDSNRRAGITFEFADVPAVHRMNAERTNEGGWEKSEMRSWLNGEFRELLPGDLRSGIVTVRKRTNNKGGSVGNDAGVVGETKDDLWLLSMSEVFGELSGQSKNVPSYPTVYDAEGVQYQLYANQGVSTTNYGFCNKDGANSWWWLRSPRAHGSGGFHYVGSGGDWRRGYAGSEWGVSPGFCF